MFFHFPLIFLFSLVLWMFSAPPGVIYPRSRVAVCMSGGIRTLIYPKVWQSLREKVIRPLEDQNFVVDFYAVLNLNDRRKGWQMDQDGQIEGTDNDPDKHLGMAREILAKFNPVSVVEFPPIGSLKATALQHQLWGIATSFQLANSHYDNYDYFLRVRTDFMYTEQIPILKDVVQNDKVMCSAVDFGAACSDMFYIIPKAAYKNWFIPKAKELMQYDQNCGMEWVLWNADQVNHVNMGGGVIRDDNTILWMNNHSERDAAALDV